MRGGARTIVEPHERFKGVYILRGKDDALVTKNLTVGESVYNEKRVSVDVRNCETGSNSYDLELRKDLFGSFSMGFP